MSQTAQQPQPVFLKITQGEYNFGKPIHSVVSLTPREIQLLKVIESKSGSSTAKEVAEGIQRGMWKAYQQSFENQA